MRRQNLWREGSLDLGPHKIQVDSGCPGLNLTDSSSCHMEKIGTTAEEFDARSRSEIFVGRAGQPREVAAVLLPTSDDASYNAGSQLTVDGGYSAQ